MYDASTKDAWRILFAPLYSFLSFYHAAKFIKFSKVFKTLEIISRYIFVSKNKWFLNLAEIKK